MITLTIFQDQPFHLLARLDAETLKNMLSLAIALAKSVFPVPGGPNRRIPLIALRIPWKNCGINLGNSTAYCKRFFATSNSAISSKLIVGHYVSYLYNCQTRLRSGPSYTSEYFFFLSGCCLELGFGICGFLLFLTGYFFVIQMFLFEVVVLVEGLD